MYEKLSYIYGWNLALIRKTKCDDRGLNSARVGLVIQSVYEWFKFLFELGE